MAGNFAGSFVAVATGCNRTQDRHSRENRPLKKGIQTGGK